MVLRPGAAADFPPTGGTLEGDVAGAEADFKQAIQQSDAIDPKAALERLKQIDEQKKTAKSDTEMAALQRDESVPPEGDASWTCGAVGGTPGKGP